MSLVLPVIHHLDENTTLEQAEIAHKCDADGIFLISHFNRDKDLAPIASSIKKLYPQENFKVGLNLLNTHPLNTFEIVEKYNLDSLWLDTPGINSNGLSRLAHDLIEKMKNSPSIEVFASLAFKYQAVENFPAKAALFAKENGFIPTTSGTKTGIPPSVEKITEMSKATDGLLAVASGMDVDNIKNYSQYLSHILVATGVSIDEHRFDKDLLQKFIKLCRN